MMMEAMMGLGIVIDAVIGAVLLSSLVWEGSRILSMSLVARGLCLCS